MEQRDRHFHDLCQRYSLMKNIGRSFRFGKKLLFDDFLPVTSSEVRESHWNTYSSGFYCKYVVVVITVMFAPQMSAIEDTEYYDAWLEMFPRES